MEREVGATPQEEKDSLISMLEEEAYFRAEAEGKAERLQIDNAQLRKQVLAYQQELAMCRKVFYHLIDYGEPYVMKVAVRSLKELKQT